MKGFRITWRWPLAALALTTLLIFTWMQFPRAEFKSAPAVVPRTPLPPAAAIPPVMQQSADHADGATTDTTADVEPAIVDVFAVRTWEPPKPVVAIAKPAPPPPPQAPPLPFRFLGKIADPDKGTAFLLIRGEEILSVGVGDTIDDRYRVDKLEAGQLYFHYQPLNIRQSLAVGPDP